MTPPDGRSAGGGPACRGTGPRGRVTVTVVGRR